MVEASIGLSGKSRWRFPTKTLEPVASGVHHPSISPFCWTESGDRLGFGQSFATQGLGKSGDHSSSVRGVIQNSAFWTELVGEKQVQVVEELVSPKSRTSNGICEPLQARLDLFFLVRVAN